MIFTVTVIVSSAIINWFFQVSILLRFAISSLKRLFKILCHIYNSCSIPLSAESNICAYSAPVYYIPFFSLSMNHSVLFLCLQFLDGRKTLYGIHCSNSGLSFVLLGVTGL